MVVGTTIAAIVVMVGAGAATYALTNNTADAKPAAGGSQAAPPTSDDAIVGDVASNDPPRTLTHAAPLKLWVGGDSLAGSFGPALGDMLGATGVVQTQIDYKVSSGLSSNDIRDWYSHATQQMASANPEAVVFIIGTNDTPIVSNLDANHDGIPDWTVDYRAKVDRMMDLLVGANHRPVIWLGPPTLGSNLNAGAIAIDQLMKEEAAKRSADITYIDTYKLFQAPDGTYSRSITDDTGKVIQARIADGVHFTEDGAQYLARAVYKVLDAHWKITQHADTSQPMGWTLADGSGEVVPGFSTAPRSRYRSSYSSGYSGSHSTTQYTSPATYEAPTYVGTEAPPATQPPTPTTQHHDPPPSGTTLPS